VYGRRRFHQETMGHAHFTGSLSAARISPTDFGPQV
jgi:hypothetical protein